MPLHERSIESFIEGFILKSRSKALSSPLPDMQKQEETARLAEQFSWSEHQCNAITNPTILICSHNSRDTRCGVLGPLLRDEFAKQLIRLDIAVSTDEFVPTVRNSQSLAKDKDSNEQANWDRQVNVGCISHIGGHKWAGNIIIYIPPRFRTPNEDKGEVSKLAGMGIWYGRVEPKHVEGIIQETLFKGNVIRELFRGGIDANGGILRL